MWKERHEGIVPNKGLGGAEPGLATQEGKRRSSASSKATASRRAPRCTTCASEARARQRRLKIGACMTTTATSGVASATNRCLQGTRLPPYRRTCKKGLP